MSPLRTLTLATILVGLAAASPTLADDSDQDPPPDDGTPDGGSQDQSQCSRTVCLDDAPRSTVAWAANARTCQPVTFTGGRPQVSTYPVLGLFYVNLAHCIPPIVRPPVPK